MKFPYLQAFSIFLSVVAVIGSSVAILKVYTPEVSTPKPLFEVVQQDSFKEEIKKSISDYLAENDKTTKGDEKPLTEEEQKAKILEKNKLAQENLIPLQADDHFKGNKDAEITFYIYSDIECPFCKKFHTTLTEFIEQHKEANDIGVVFRHFPLQSIHQNATMFAAFSECIAKTSGEDAFWSYLDEMFSEDNKIASQEDFDNIVKKAGGDKNFEAISECSKTEESLVKIKNNFDSGVKMGLEGTPGIIVKNNKTGKTIAFSGSVPVEALEYGIEEVKKEGDVQL